MLRSAVDSLSLGVGGHPLPPPQLMRNEPKKLQHDKLSMAINGQEVGVSSTGTTYTIDSLMADFVSVSTDATGQYIAGTSTSPAALYLSQDAGATFYQAASPTGSNGAYQVAIASEAPNYVAVGGANCLAASSDYGNSFQCVSPAGMYYWTSVALSANASHAYTIYGSTQYENAKIYYSNNYLFSFNYLSVIPTGDYRELATSSNGQYLYITTGNGVYSYSDYGYTATYSSSSLCTIASIACSSTGQYVAVTCYYGVAYISNNFGKSWSKPSGLSSISGIITGASFSSTGQYVTLVANGPAVYTSNDYGKSFTMTNSPAQSYSAVTSSADGTSIYAVASQSHLFKSTDSGLTWTPLFYAWYGVASSQSGQYRIVTTENYNDNAVYLSSDGGATWQDITSSTPNPSGGLWFTASCNSDCQYIVLTTEVNKIALSSDYGQSWKTVTIASGSSANSLVITQVAISSTGQYMTAATNTGLVYTSTNYGNSFTAVSGVPQNYWAVTMSADGMLQLVTTVYYSFHSGATSGK